MTGEPVLECTFEQGDPTRLVVAGDIDVATAPSFAAALRQALAGGAAVDLDMSAVEFMDSSGIGELIRCGANATADSDRRLVIVAASLKVRRILEVTGLATMFGLPTNSE